MKVGDKVRISDRVGDMDEELKGKTGMITRMKMSGDACWVNMDDKLPDKLQAFPDGDPRNNHRSFYFDELEPVK